MNTKLRQSRLLLERVQRILSNVEDHLQEEMEEQVMDWEDIQILLEENQIDGIWELSRNLIDLADNLEDRILVGE